MLLGVEPPPEEPFETAKLSPMSASFFAEEKRVSNAKAKRLLGFKPAYPTYREGLGALADGRGARFPAGAVGPDLIGRRASATDARGQRDQRLANPGCGLREF